MISARELIEALPHFELRNWVDQDVTSIAHDSRRVVPGSLFVAIPGVAVDGHDYVPAALRSGASICVVEREIADLQGRPTVLVPDAREALAYLHAAWHDFPGRKMRVIGVTGTDGKTTTVRLITRMLEAAGWRVGRVDTVSAAVGSTEVATGFHTTTPDAPEVQTYLDEMVKAGAQYVVLESTSHGLAQHRVTACEYDVAVVTNITHEHLDYHGTYEAYREAKALLFRALASAAQKPGVPKVAVLNADDTSFEYLRAIPAQRQIIYGLGDVDVQATDLHASPEGLRFEVSLAGERQSVFSPLIGIYNVHNILAAISVGHSQGISLDVMAQAVAQTKSFSGRMERIACGQPFTAIVDFAHTPNALENALSTVRELGKRVIVVFGCAGLRDRAKRPWMGEIAGRLADRTIITAEDPRTESLDDIMEEIAAGCREAGRTEGQEFWRIGDRREAIKAALSMAQAGDVVIVTGKGHERSMCFGTTEYPWCDQEALGDALVELGYS